MRSIGGDLQIVFSGAQVWKIPEVRYIDLLRQNDGMAFRAAQIQGGLRRFHGAQLSESGQCIKRRDHKQGQRIPARHRVAFACKGEAAPGYGPAGTRSGQRRAGGLPVPDEEIEQRRDGQDREQIYDKADGAHGRHLRNS